MEITPSPFPNNSAPPMPMQPEGVGYPGGTGNPVLDEISAAHANLSPQAQQAIEGAHEMVGLSPEKHTDPALTASTAPSPELAVPGVSGPLPILSPEVPAPSRPMAAMSGTPMAEGFAARPSSNAVPLPSGLGVSPSGGTPMAIQSPAPAMSAEEQERARLTAPPLPSSDPNAHTSMDTGRTGIGQIHNPWLRGLATAGDVIASGVFPRFGQFIPGTSGYHNNLVSANERAIQSEEGSAKSAADVAHTGAETGLENSQSAEAQARADTLKSPPKAGLQVVGDGLYDAANKTWIKEPTDKDADKLTEVDPEYGKSLHIVPTKDGKYLVPSAAIGELLKPKTPVEGETPLTNVDQLNKAMETRYQILHPGGALPPQFTLPASATQKDYDRLDKALAGTESALGTKAQRDAAESARGATAELAKQGASERTNAALDKEIAQYGKYHEDTHKAATQQLDKIQDAQTMIAKDSPESLALAIPKVLTALISGQGTGVRITQAELNQIAKARGLGGDLQAWVSKVVSGKNVTDDQRKQLSDVLDEIGQKVQEKGRIAGNSEDRIKSSNNRSDILKADKEGREQLDHFERGEIKVQIPGQEPGFIPSSQKAAFVAKYPSGTVF